MHNLSNNFLIFYRHPSPWVLTVALILTVSMRVASGPLSVWDAIIAGIIITAWPFIEWLVHRFVLHARTINVGRLKLDVPAAQDHRKHHADPSVPGLVFVPLWTYIITLPALFAVPVVLQAAAAWTLAATVLTLGLRYEWIHFLIHSRYRPTGRRYARMRRAHLLHHFKNERYWMGVTTSIGDRAFGTAPDPNSIETSETCRNLDSSVFTVTRDRPTDG